MTVWHAILSYLWPQSVAQVSSRVNGRIRIVRYWGSYRLVAGDLTQSGGLVTDLWRTALESARRLHFRHQLPRHALILGFGGGSAALCLRRCWPAIKITGIDLDPVMVKLGNKYIFPVSPGVTITIANAFTYMNTNHTQYDLIIVDLYLGNNIPLNLYSDDFLNNIKESLTLSGCALFNIFAAIKHRSSAEAFIPRLQAHFLTVTRLPTLSNWVILVTNYSGKIKSKPLE